MTGLDVANALAAQNLITPVGTEKIGNYEYSAIGALASIGATLNIMTLGGLALAVGILVDEATVTIESINHHLEQGKDVETAILVSRVLLPRCLYFAGCRCLGV